MEKKLLEINGDKILEVKETKEVVTRFSKNKLLRRKSICEAMISQYTTELENVNLNLGEIANEENK